MKRRIKGIIERCEGLVLDIGCVRHSLENENVRMKRGDKGLSLDVGCGDSKVGDIGVDFFKLEGVDVICDITKGLPFKDSTFDKIYCLSVLEHVYNLPHIMEEIYRVGKNRCTVEICVPHFTSPSAFRDPTHKTFFAYRTFEHFFNDSSFTTKTYYSNSNLKILKRRITFKKFPYFWNIILEILANKFPDFYEWTFLRLFPAANVLVTLEVVKDGS